MGFYIHAFGNTLPHERKSRLGGSLSFAYSRHRFVIEKCVWLRGIVFVVQGSTFSSSHLFLAAWLIHHPVFRIRGYPHRNGFCWFEWCLSSPPETFRSLHSGHAQGLGNYSAARIWPARVDGSLPYGGLILPYSIVVLTSTQVLPTDGTNCRVHFWEVLYCWRK